MSSIKLHGKPFLICQKCPTIQEIALINQFAQRVEVWQRDAQDVTRWHYRYYDPGDTVEFASINVRIVTIYPIMVANCQIAKRKTTINVF